MALRNLTRITAKPLRGGCVTALERAQLPFGAFSAVNNLRGKHPGFINRPGQTQLHTTSLGTDVNTLYQFRKAQVSETHFFAQCSDDDVYEATSSPPAVTSGAFGSVVHTGTAGTVPASWSVLNDQLVYSNGADQHQIYAGDSSYVEKFIVLKGTEDSNMPAEGEDYTTEVSGGDGNAILDSLNTYANHHCFYIKTPVRAKSFSFTISKANGTAATLSMYYMKASNNTWTSQTITDNTASGGATLAVDGTVTFTAPTDDKYHYQYGSVGFWYQFRVSAQLDSEVEISAVTYEADFQDIENIWDGVNQGVVEAWVEEASSTWGVYGTSAIDLDELASGNKVMLFCVNPTEAWYWDVGDTPSTTAGVTPTIKYWDGSSFNALTLTNDGTGGLLTSGWMTVVRPTDEQPTQYGDSGYYAYVYEVTFSGALSADTVVGVEAMPYYDIADYGKGQACCTWKDRMVYSFDKYGKYLYVSTTDQPQALNGLDYGVLVAGDGRSNKILAMAVYHNELMVWQEEKGVEGGCLTLFEGYSPTTFGKILLSSRVGIMNAKCVAVVDGVMTSTGTEEKVRTLAFWVSRYGVCVSDGRSVSIISDDVGNYFDPTSADCVTRGQEDQHWLAYDSTYNVIRVGLVTGTGATEPNTFLVFDLTDKVWSTDSFGTDNELRCVTEVEADSGDVTVIQVGGATNYVGLLNTGRKDAIAGTDRTIDSYLDIELNAGGEYLNVRELLIRCKAQSSGDVTLSTEVNDVSDISNKTLSMEAEVSGQMVRRHRIPVSITDQAITVRFRNNTDDEDMYLLDFGVTARVWEGR